VGIDARIVILPRTPRFVSTARVKWRHVGIQARNDLDYRKPFAYAISYEPLKIIGPAQALAQAHPPCVPQPEERRSIRVLEVAAIRPHLHRAILQQRIVTRIRRDFQQAILAMQVRVGGIAAARFVRISA
jgi:hypothetical protein